MPTELIFEPLPIPQEVLPDRLPQHWRFIKGFSTPTCMAWTGPKGLKVILGAGREADGRRWLHASMSHKNRLPSYEELKLLHRLWLGSDRRAIQVFAPASSHVNVHSYCLHLWACLDDDGLPDFSRGLGII